MSLRGNRFFVFIAFMFLSFITVTAQKQDDFKMEFGFHLGGSGRTSAQLLNRIQLEGGLNLRYKFDDRLALRAELIQAGVYSTYRDAETMELMKLTNPVLGFDICGEFNFFEFDTDPYKLNARRITPYIFAGIGILSYPYDGSYTVQPAIPLGVGFKIKLAPRLNMNIQYVHRLTFVDNMEGVPELNDTYKVKGSNFLNKDMLSVFSVGLTFDFWKRKGTCYCP